MATKKVALPQIITLKVIQFDDLKFADRMENGGFDSVSYGDAENTLVWPTALISELEHREKSETDGPKGHLLPLIDELKAIPKGVYVGLGS